MAQLMNRSEPPDYVRLTRSQRRALAAVLGGAVLISEICEACGWSSKNTAHVVLTQLRRLGLVDWVPGKQGTLRPTVRVVA